MLVASVFAWSPADFHNRLCEFGSKEKKKKRGSVWKSLQTSLPFREVFRISPPHGGSFGNTRSGCRP
jgi:hypothetical protein